MGQYSSQLRGREGKFSFPMWSGYEASLLRVEGFDPDHIKGGWFSMCVRNYHLCTSRWRAPSASMCLHVGIPSKINALNLRIRMIKLLSYQVDYLMLSCSALTVSIAMILLPVLSVCNSWSYDNSACAS